MSDFRVQEARVSFFFRDRAFYCYYYYWFFSSFTEVNPVAQFPGGHFHIYINDQSKQRPKFLCTCSSPDSRNTHSSHGVKPVTKQYADEYRLPK
jgi:hypothetical protein